LGQFNSTFFDTGIGVSQSFSLPQVYRRRKAYSQQQANTASAYLKLTEAQIMKQLLGLFEEYAYLNAKEKVISKQDSLYTIFADRAKIRWENGETDILEKATADQQKVLLNNQLGSVKMLKEYVITELAWLINDNNKYIPEVTIFSPEKNSFLYDSLSIIHHPALIAADHEIVAARLQTQMEKSALLPDVSLAYRNVSIRGTGADNEVYTAGDRFSSFQIGLGIPIFTKGIRSTIKAAEIMEEVKLNEYNSAKAHLSTQIKQQYELYLSVLEKVKLFEEQALPNAELVRDVAQKQFDLGEINYLEMVMLTNQSFSMENEYIELMRSLNSHVVELKYLTIKN